MILFCITSFNNIMYELVAKKSNRGETVILTNRLEVFEWGKSTNVHAIFNLLIPLLKNNIEIDELFSSIALPGLLGDEVFPGTELPISSVLSLDRLKFWFDAMAEQEQDYVDAFSPDEVYISLDLGSSLPWIVYLSAIDNDVPITLVQTEDIRTKEFLDFIKLIDIDNIIVTPDNVDFVRNVCDINVIERGAMVDGEKEVESQKRQELRKGFGIQDGEKIVGVLFDKRDEWQCRRWLSENIGSYSKIFVYPIDNRSADLATDVLRGYLPAIDVINDESVLDVCDDVISFRYYHNRFTAFNVIYSDYAGLNRVDELK